MKVRTAIVAAVLGLLSTAVAQNSPSTIESNSPKICVALRARLSLQSLVSAKDRLDSTRIQDALDNCAPGTMVALRRDGGNAVFVTGPIELRRGITLFVDRGVTLSAAQDPKLYARAGDRCITYAACKPLIHVVGATDTAITGAGVIDDRGFAKLIEADHADNLTLSDLTLKNASISNVTIRRTRGVTVSNVKIKSRNSVDAGGIEISSSKNVSISNSFLHVSGDNIRIEAGQDGPSSDITISDSHFYSGRALTIGEETSGNIENVIARGVTIENAEAGISVISNSAKGGFVRNVAFEDVCVDNTRRPIVIDPNAGTERGISLPNFGEIAFTQTRILSPGTITILGSDDYHRTRVSFDGVQADGYLPQSSRFSRARIKIGQHGVNFLPSGEDVVVNGTAERASAPACDRSRFLSFPKEEAAPVRANNNSEVTVNADGSADFTSVQDAVESLPPNGGTIHVRRGTYREVVEVTKPNVRIVGDPNNPKSVVIVSDKSAGDSGGTFRSYTMLVAGDDFSADGITIENDFGKRHPEVKQSAQAVALAVRGDRDIFSHVRLLGAQDTLYVSAKSCESDSGPCVRARQYFEDCYIEGDVDFIFGDAQAYFRNCEMHAFRNGTVYLTAQSKRYPAQESGFAFDSCRVTASEGTAKIYLGRPWRRYSTVVFLNTELPEGIEPSGWSEWNPGETNALSTATYAEFRSRGLGANSGARESHSRQLSPDEAEAYSVTKFFAGWNPANARQLR